MLAHFNVLQNSKYDKKYSFVGLKLSYMLFQHTDNLSRSLQSSDLSAANGTELAQTVVELIQSFRTEENFATFYKDVETAAKQLGMNTNSAKNILIDQST